MKRTNTLCALFILLITSSSTTYAGVTDGGVTAYNWASSTYLVMFTNNPSDDPLNNAAPLGAAGFTEFLQCSSAATGTDLVQGLLCSGTSGDPIETYTCLPNIFGPALASSTSWCLFSETPRTGGKAWAVKYVDGIIPTNDGASIVRCEGSDTFDSVNGCQQPHEISIETGFIKLDTTDGPPEDGFCSEPEHSGRMVVDDSSIFICLVGGWQSILLD